MSKKSNKIICFASQCHPILIPPFSYYSFLRCPLLLPPFPIPPFSRTDSSGFTAVVRLCYTTLPLRPDNGGFTAAQQTTYAKALLLLRKFSPLWGRPPPRSGGGRPQRGGMDDGRTFICRNLTTKWLSRTTLVLTRRGAAAMCAAGEAKRRKIQKPTNKTVLF